MENKCKQNPNYYNNFSKRTRKYWINFIIGGTGLLGFCKICDTSQKILTNPRHATEVAYNSALINQYFHELFSSIGSGQISPEKIPEVILPTLGMICISAPIAFGLGTIAKKVIQRKKQ